MTDERPIAILLTPVLPLPTGSGRSIRAWGWLTELARDFRVEVLVCEPLPSGWRKPDRYPAVGVRPVAVRTPNPLERWAGIGLPALATLSPRFVYDWSFLSPSEDLAIDGRVDRIVVFRCYLHGVAQQLFRRFPQAKRTLDMDDLESSTRSSVAGASWRLGRVGAAVVQFTSGLQYRCIEAPLCSDYHGVTLANPEDAAQLQRRTATPISVRPNSVEAPPDPLPVQDTGRLNLLFVGTLVYPPNEEAVKEIVTRLAPLLRQRLAVPFTLTIAGRGAPRELRDLLRDTNEIRFFDGPEDLRALYADSDLVLVPLRAGGGTKVKFIEALAHRRPVLSTSEGARGIDAEAREHFFPAETPDEFADVIERLSRNPQERLRVAEAGWQHYRQLYRPFR